MWWFTQNSGCGSGSGEGETGGIRIIYLHVAIANWFYMLDLYGKDEKDDLTPGEKKELQKLAEVLKKQAKLNDIGQKGKNKS